MSERSNAAWVALAERLKAAREALGWSQNELARRAGLNHPTVNRIELGSRKDPQVSIVAALARALGTTVEQLVGDEPGATPRGRSPVRNPWPALQKMQEQLDKHQQLLEQLLDQPAQSPPKQRRKGSGSA